MYVPFEQTVFATSIGASAATAQDGTNFAAVAGTWCVCHTEGFQVNTATGLVTYRGNTMRKFLVHFNISVEHNQNNVLIQLALYKNGIYQSISTISRFIATGADRGALGGMAVVQLEPGDTVQMYIQSNKAGNATCYHGHLVGHNID